jgi:hypothetical protein
MAINLKAKQILLIILCLCSLFYIKVTNSALIIPNIHYSVPNIPFDTTGCIYNGQTWTNPIGKVWDGYEWK